MPKDKRIPVLLLIIFFSAFLIYQKITPANSFYPDINEIYSLPEDIEKMLENPASNPLAEAPLVPAIPSHFKIPILLYHYVEYVKDRGDKIRISLNIEPFIFDQQIKTLKDAGYTFITPREIPKYFSGLKKIPVKPVILSFDDGYKDFYTDVFPVLKKYNVRAVAYIVPGFLDKPNNLATWQLKEIAKSGLVEIGAHTMYHSFLKGMDEKEAKLTIEQSKTYLEKNLGIKIVSFAYPYGAFDLKTAQIVKKLGFKTALSTVSGSDVNLHNLFFLYRIRPGYRTGESLLKIL